MVAAAGRQRGRLRYQRGAQSGRIQFAVNIDLRVPTGTIVGRFPVGTRPALAKAGAAGDPGRPNDSRTVSENRVK